MFTSRRELIEMALRAAALPAGAEFFAAWLAAGQSHNHAAASEAPPEADFLTKYQPQFFGAEDFEALEAVTQILIPSDETPGAKEAHCAHYIDYVLHASADAPAAQKQWRAATAALRIAGFHVAGQAGREALIAEAAKPETDRTDTHPCYAAYRLIKAQNAFAFYTSRAGMIQALDYRGNSYNLTFPGCNHPEHKII